MHPGCVIQLKMITNYLLATSIPLLLILNFKKIQNKLIIYLWMHKLKIKKHLKTYKNISKNINGYRLSKSSRIDNDAFEYTYGEIDFVSFVALLSLTKPNANTVFYDLGSGAGQAIFATAMVFNIKKSCGIEIFKNLNNASLKQKQILANTHNYQDNALKISFINEDFLTTNLDDATLIFINATALFGEIWENLNSKLAKLQNKPIIITTTKKLLPPSFTIITTTKMQMNFGVVDVYIQQQKA